MKRLGWFFFHIFFIIVSQYSFCIEPIVIADNFIKDKYEFSFIAEASFYRTDHFWNEKGKRRRVHNKLDQRLFPIFVEFGVTQDDTIGLYMYNVINDESMNGKKEGFSDIELCWKRYLTSRNGYDFSLRAIGIIPTGESIQTVRYGRFGVELDLHCQKHFTIWDRCGWFELMGGYRYYNGFPSDQIKLNGVIGYQLFSRLRLLGAFYLDYGLFNGHAKFCGPILTLPPRFRLLTTKFYGVITITQWAEVFAGSFQNIWGENIGTGAGYFGGLSIDF